MVGRDPLAVDHEAKLVAPSGDVYPDAPLSMVVKSAEKTALPIEETAH